MAPIAGRLRSRGGRDGAIAQLGERVVRNDEVGGSIPPGSTTLRPSGFAWRSHVMPKGEAWCPAKPTWAKTGCWTTVLTPSLPRKPRRPFLHEARHAFTEIAAAQGDPHLAIG